MPLRLKVAQKGMILVLIPAVFELIFVLALAVLLYGESVRYFGVQSSKDLLLRSHRFYGLTASAIQIMETASEAMPNDQKALVLEDLKAKMVKHNQKWDQEKNLSDPELAELDKEATRIKGVWLDGLDKAIQAHKGEDAGLRAVEQLIGGQGMMLFMEDTREVNKAFTRFENRLAEEEPKQEKAFKQNLNLIVWSGVFINTVGSIVLIMFFTSYLTARLREIYSKAQLIAASKPLPEPSSSEDELGELDRVITDAGRTLEEARRRELAIFEGSSHVMCSLDNKLRFQTVSGTARDHWKLTADELLGRTLLSLSPGGDVEETRVAFESLAKTSKEGRIETVMRRGDGSIRTMLWHVRWQNGIYYCVVQDITEVRNVEKLRQHFFSMASHELRSPLTAVGMNVSLVTGGAKGAVPKEVVSELNKIDSHLTQLLSLVNEILMLEKLEATKTDLPLNAVSAEDVFQLAKENVEDLATESDVKILGPRGSALLNANEEKLEQALTNLIAGVLKFARPGSEIRLSVEKRDQTALLNVDENSYTISETEATLIFDKFQQTYIESDRPVRRAGFGFAIAKTIAEKHGGTVGVAPRPEGGSTFWIAIPLHTEDSEL